MSDEGKGNLRVRDRVSSTNPRFFPGCGTVEKADYDTLADPEIYVRWDKPPLNGVNPSWHYRRFLIRAELIPVNGPTTPSDFATNEAGMQKQAAGKLDLKYCPPEWPVYLAEHMYKGHEKGYDFENWRKTGSILELAIPIYRHLLDYLAGNDTDPKDGSDNLDAIACGALMLRSKRDASKLTDDRNVSGEARPPKELIEQMLYARKEKTK